MAEQSTGVKYAISIDDTELRKAAQDVSQQFSGMSKAAAVEGAKIDSTMKKVATAIGGYFSIQAAINFARQIKAVRSEVQALEISFRTLLGSEERANKLLSDLKEYAVRTPLQLNDLSKGAQTLLSFNVEAEKVMPILKAIGDISMGDAQKLQSLTLAFSQMSSTGRLMGQDLLQMINAGFNPLTIIAEKTGKSVATLKDEMSKGAVSAQMVEDAFIAATSEGGKFFGMLEQQSQSVSGAFSNLEGAVFDMMNKIGESVQGPVIGALTGLTGLVKSYEKLGTVLATTVATVGAYKAAVIAVTIAERVSAQTKAGATVATLALEKAQALLNKTMLANPYVLAATAVAALVVGIISYKRQIRDTRTEQQKLNDLLAKAAEEKQNLKDETEKLIGTATDENSSNLERHEALKKLKAMYPEYLSDLKTEKELTEALAKLKSDLPEIADEKEAETIKGRADELQRYVALMREYNDVAQRRRNSYRVGDTDEQRSELDKQMDTIRKQIDAINKDFDGSVVEAARKAGYNSIDAYIDAYKAAAAQKKNEIEEARFEAAPVKVKIGITENAIAKVQMQIANTKRQIEQQPWNIGLKLNLKDLEEQLDALEARKNSLEESQKQSKDDYSLSGIKKRIKEQQAELRKANMQNDKEAAQKAQDALDEAKKDYKLRTGKDYDNVVKEAQNLAKEQRKIDNQLIKEKASYERTLIMQARAAAREREQVEIDVMDDGAAKKQRQIELDYRRRMDAADDYETELLERLRDIREKEWEAANQEKVKQGETFDRESVTADMLDEAQKAQVKAKRDAAEKMLRHDTDIARKEADALLDEYRDLQEKIRSIEERYSKLREQAGGDTATRTNIDNAQRREIAALVLDSFRAEESIGKVAEQVQSLGRAARTALQNSLQKIVDFVNRRKAQNGLPEQLRESVADFAALNNVSEQFLNSLLETDGAFEAFVEYVKNLGGDMTEPIDNIAKAIRNFKAAKEKATRSGDIIDIDNLEYAQELLEGMTRQLADNILQTGDAIAQMFREIAEMTGNESLAKAGDIMSDIVSNVQAAEKGAEAWGGWWGAIIAGVIDLIPKVVKWINMGNKEGAEYIENALSYAQQMASYWQSIYQHNNWEAPDWTQSASDLARFAQEYNRLNRQWDAMDWNIFASDEDFQRVADRLNELSGLITGLTSGAMATGRDAFNNYVSMLDKQIEAINSKIDNELSKRKPDEGVLAELLAQLAQLVQDKIDSTLEYAENRIGISASTLFSDLTDMITKAFDDGKDGIDDFAAYFNKTIRKMIIDSVLARVLKDRIDDMVQSLAWSVDEGHFEGEEAQNWINWYRSEFQQLAEAGMRALDPLSEILQGLAVATETSPVGKGIATASQESVDELNGRMTTIQANTTELLENSALNVHYTSSILSVVTNIKSDTGAIRSDIADMRSDLHSLKQTVEQI